MFHDIFVIEKCKLVFNFPPITELCIINLWLSLGLLGQSVLVLNINTIIKFKYNNKLYINYCAAFLLNKKKIFYRHQSQCFKSQSYFQLLLYNYIMPIIIEYVFISMYVNESRTRGWRQND